MTNTLTCNELVELLTDYLELALAEDERARFERHLAACGACQIYVSQIQQTIDGIHALAATDITAEQRARLIELFRSWRAEQPATPESPTYDER